MAGAEYAARIRPTGIACRAGLVGIGYLVVLAFGGGLLVSLGARFPQVEDSAALFPWILLSGVLIGLVLGSIASQMPASRGRHAFVWITLLFLNSVAVLIEGLFFVPDLISLETVPFLAVQQLIASIGMAILIAFLFAPSTVVGTTTELPRRAWHAWFWRIVASVLIYVLLFFVIGGLNYALVTRPFYEQQLGLATPETPTVIAVETLRGVLIVASILPFMITFQSTKRRLMILSGMLLFVVGGVVPLMLQATTLPGPLILASGLEIFLQLFPTGMVSAALLVR